MTGIQSQKGSFENLEVLKLSFKSSCESTVASQDKKRRKSISGFIFYIDEQMLLQQTKAKEQEIFSWFHAKNIKNGNPEKILLDYQQTQRKKIFNNQLDKKNQMPKELKLNSVNFAVSSLMARRLSKKQPMVSY